MMWCDWHGERKSTELIHTTQPFAVTGSPPKIEFRATELLIHRVTRQEDESGDQLSIYRGGARHQQAL